MGETKTGIPRTVPLPDVLAVVLREHRRKLLERQAPGLEAGWVFPTATGKLHYTTTARRPFVLALAIAGISRAQTAHGLRRTVNNLVRQVTTGEVVRAMTGHVTVAMTDHYSHVGLGEKHAAVDRVLAQLEK